VEVAKQKPLPANLRRVWRWFWDLNEGRSSQHDLIPEHTENKEFSWRTRRRVDRFGHSEIMAWLTLNDLRLEPWEMAAISLLDEVYVKAFNSAGSPERVTVSSRKLTSRVFDALFPGS
jgi:hypothetical protein